MAIYDGPILDYPIEILRGWPNDGAMDLSETISSAATGASGLAAGNIVTVAANGTVQLCFTPQAPMGLCVRGNNDNGSSVTSAVVGELPGVYGDQAVVIWGNCAFRTTVYNTASVFAPGTAVTGINGLIDVATGTQPIFGYVKSVYPASGTMPASLVIIMK